MSLNRTHFQNQVELEIENKRNIISHIKFLGGYLLFNLIIYCVLRLVFVLWNANLYKNYNFLNWLKVILQGVRFDIMIVVPLVSLIFLGIILISNQWVKKIYFWFIIVFHSSLLFINCVDIELVNFMGRRFTKASLYLAGEGQTQNLAQYKTLFTFTAVLLFLFYWCNQWFFKKADQNLKPVKLLNKIYFSFALIIVSVISGRGGFQYKPLSYVDAKVIDDLHSHQVVLNTSFTFVKSLQKNKDLERVKYFDRKKMLSYLNQDVQKLQIKSNVQAQGFFKNKNFVLIIVESLSTEYVSSINTPFLDSLKQDSLYFKNFYANGRRSIEGIAAILAGIPALMEQPFLNSEFATNEFVGLGQLFKNKKYSTSFFHGATNGSMHFDQFANTAGFNNYYGKNEYYKDVLHAKNDDDQHWGIYDEPFLQYMCEKLVIDTKQPFASVVFTLSSHQPFVVPNGYEKNVPTYVLSRHPIAKSIHYTDSSIRKFFECMNKNKEVFSNTVFLITADHTGPLLGESFDKLSPYFKIPLWIYSPQKNFKKEIKIDESQFGQQIDIIPTVAELFNLSLFNKNYLSRSLTLGGEKTIALYSDKSYELVGDTELSEDHLKAIKQYFAEGMYDNRLYSK